MASQLACCLNDSHLTWYCAATGSGSESLAAAGTWLLLLSPPRYAWHAMQQHANACCPLPAPTLAEQRARDRTKTSRPHRRRTNPPGTPADTQTNMRCPILSCRPLPPRARAGHPRPPASECAIVSGQMLRLLLLSCAPCDQQSQLLQQHVSRLHSLSRRLAR